MPSQSEQYADNDELIWQLIDLTSSQHTAVTSLAAGATHAEAADAAGVCRETVTRWASHHVGFRDALARCRWLNALEQQSQVAVIRNRALAILNSHLSNLDAASPEAARTAVMVLRYVQAHDPTPPPVISEFARAEIKTMQEAFREFSSAPTRLRPHEMRSILDEWHEFAGVGEDAP